MTTTRATCWLVLLATLAACDDATSDALEADSGIATDAAPDAASDVAGDAPADATPPGDAVVPPVDAAPDTAADAAADSAPVADAEGPPTGDAEPPPDACLPGVEDCVCGADESCADGLFCAAGVCRAPRCDPGDEGCPCFAGGTCRSGPDGRPMSCEGGLCQVLPCPEGDEGCPCQPFDACMGGFVCQDGRCLDPGCAPGADRCVCLEDQTCEAGLVCAEGRCLDPGCRLGSEGCLCADEACEAGLVCDRGACLDPCPAGSRGCACDEGLCGADLSCVDERCVEIGCDPGAPGCICDDLGACGEGAACQANRCVPNGCAPGSNSCVCLDGRCDAGLACDGLGICRGCPAGAEGCGCRNGRCDAGLVCGAGDTCAPPPCGPGTEGCDCAVGQSCGLNSRGEEMACADGICAAPSCTPGDTGCACLVGTRCIAVNDDCVSGFCQPAGCAPGSPFCGCAAGRCVGDLVCRDAVVCVDGTGFDGGPCFEGGGCRPENRCEIDRCVACAPGTLGCDCDEGACFAGALCHEEVCVDPDAVELPPANPVCYTPCERSFEDDRGVYRRCDASGLMQGCLDGRDCVDGSCLAEGEAALVCDDDTQCPDYQTCIGGSCYAQCARDDECRNGTECFRHVCRAPCRSGDAEAIGCGADEHCRTTDGELGHCMPLVPPEEAVQFEVRGGITLDRKVLEFSNADPSESIVFTNEAPTQETIRIRKVSHEVFRADATRDARHDPDDDVDCDPARDCPLHWLTIGPPDGGRATSEYALTLEPGESARIEFGGADEVAGVRWQGVVEVLHPSLNGARVTLSYTEVPEGVWTGSVYYFGSFGTADLDTWSALPNPAPGAPPNAWAGTKDDAQVQERVGNAFIQRWGAFRRGRISWEEFQAVLTATQSESWRWPSVTEDCPQAACYLYQSNRLGLREYSSDLDTLPVPSGVVELPFGANLRVDPEDPARLVGRIESANALHYAGNPSLAVTFDGDATQCARTVGGACLVYLDELQADIAVGGRYESSAADFDCAAHEDGSYLQFRTPWLLPGFERNTALDADTGARYRHECRDTLLPFQAGLHPEAERFGNLALTGANPVPDGRARRRSITLVDGALINQTILFIVFEERFASFLDPVNDTDGFSAYGYMILRRNPGEVDLTDANDDEVPDLYQGTDPVDDRVEPRDQLDVHCDPDLVSEYLGQEPLREASAGRLLNGLLRGVLSPDAAQMLAPGTDEEAHYLCKDTGAFDDDCPEGSEAIYFTLDRREMTERELLGLECNDDGSCLGTLLDMRDDGALLQYGALWRCADERRVFCSGERDDLRAGKLFYADADQEAVSLPMRSAVAEAFRYKTRFRSRQGRNIGFAPDICLPDSDQMPYCYDPLAIEDLRRRADCVLHLQERYYDALSVDDRDLLDTYLEEHFSYTEEEGGPGNTLRHDGFERLYAEILVMLGDESITRSFASRFDLAGLNAAAFEGSLFEHGGIDLAGQAGFEMYELYRAVQYYQEALDRFYALSPRIWRAIQLGAERRNFVSSATVTWYFDRLVRASSQKTRAWSQVAKRYQAFNRPDLARGVIERAYTGAYLESIIMSRMMLGIVGAVAPEERAQIQRILEETQRRYRVALLDMREAYAGITDRQGFFGLPPDFVPIPALDTEDFRQSNGFEVLLRRAQAKTQVARQREDLAIESSRSFDTDAAQFQAELVRIRNTYEDQLAQICGVFTGEDGVVYPATARYGDQSNFTAALGDPCGFVGNGSIHEQAAQFELMEVDMRRLVVQQENVFASVEIERARAAAQCNLQLELADFVYEREGQIDNIETAISAGRVAVARADRALSAISTTAQLTKCSVGLDEAINTCTTAGISTAIFQGAYVGLESGVAIIDGLIVAGERRINDIRRRTARWQTAQQCQVVLADSNARMADMLLRVNELEVEMLRVEYQGALELSQLQQHRQQATRLQQQQAEAEQLQLNAEAARNDPNIRIYRNDAVINADLSFEDAMRAAYRLTRVFEYYTSQSYAGQERLYLIRLISRGEYNLENYLVDIENAFYEFEEEFGLPDTRVLQISLRDNILAIPRLDEDGQALTEGQRTARMREALRDPQRLDENGYLTLPFATRIDDLSPLTRNHKVFFIEAEVVASDFGADHVGRLYLRQEGTGVIRTVEEELRYYRLPTRVAVLNPFFNASRFFDNSIYRNHRLRDRPLVNTAWDLVINQRDEQANQDINLQSVTDIRLFIYYTDFTAQF